MKKIPISFNDMDLKDQAELEDLLNLSNVYGGFPKSLKFSIKLALSTIKNPGKVYADLKGEDLELYFSSIKKSEIKQRLLDQSIEIGQKASLV